MSLHPKTYRFVNTLDRISSDAKPHLLWGVITNCREVNKTMLCNCGYVFQISPVPRANHPFAQKTSYLETSEIDESQNGNALFRTWTEAMEEMAVEKRGMDGENDKMLSLFHQCNWKCQNRLKISVLRRYHQDMQEYMREYIHSVDGIRLVLVLDRVSRSRGYRRQGSDKKKTSFHSTLSCKNGGFFWKVWL